MYRPAPRSLALETIRVTYDPAAVNLVVCFDLTQPADLISRDLTDHEQLFIKRAVADVSRNLGASHGLRRPEWIDPTTLNLGPTATGRARVVQQICWDLDYRLAAGESGLRTRQAVL